LWGYTIANSEKLHSAIRSGRRLDKRSGIEL
jgi:hypothetical protein